MKTEKSLAGWYFLLGTILLATVLLLLKPEIFPQFLDNFLDLLKKIVPLMIVVFALMFIINYFVSKERLLKYLGKEAKKKGWFVAVISGIISTGPIYMWYPLLSDLQEKGARTAYLAVFLYNRAIKPALLPLIIFYFGLKLTVVLTVVMIVASILQGFLVEKIMDTGKSKISGTQK